MIFVTIMPVGSRAAKRLEVKNNKDVEPSGDPDRWRIKMHVFVVMQNQAAIIAAAFLAGYMDTHTSPGPLDPHVPETGPGTWFPAAG
jgi:hypothetical protein